jgi:hypothetical protein
MLQAWGTVVLPEAVKGVKDICLAPDGRLSAVATQVGLGVEMN